MHTLNHGSKGPSANEDCSALTAVYTFNLQTVFDVHCRYVKSGGDWVRPTLLGAPMPRREV